MKVKNSVSHDASGFVMVIVPEPWVDDARCSYDNVPDVFMGYRVRDDDGDYVLSRDEFMEVLDVAFFGEHDSRWTSGGESKALHGAVDECLRCPVRDACLRYAFEEESSTADGVYGGSTAHERKAIVDLSNELLSGLSNEQRIDLMTKVVDAKAFGVVPFSVRIDTLKKAFMRLSDVEWEQALAEAVAETDAAELLDMSRPSSNGKSSSNATTSEATTSNAMAVA